MTLQLKSKVVLYRLTGHRKELVTRDTCILRTNRSPSYLSTHLFRPPMAQWVHLISICPKMFAPHLLSPYSRVDRPPAPSGHPTDRKNSLVHVYLFEDLTIPWVNDETPPFFLYPGFYSERRPSTPRTLGEKHVDNYPHYLCVLVCQVVRRFDWGGSDQRELSKGSPG